MAALVALLLAVSCSGDHARETERPSQRPATSATPSRRCPAARTIQASGALSPPVRAFDRVERRPTGVVATIGRFAVAAALDPLRVSARVDDRPVVTEVPGGLSLDGARATTARIVRADRCGVRLAVRFTGGRKAEVSLQAAADDTVAVTLVPDGSRRTATWGERLVTPPDERIYGLTERIVDDLNPSEITPAAVGSLDRKGERVTMSVRPTIAAYAPFFQSSRGYGLLVDGTMPGVYDVAKTTRNEVSFRFDIDPTAQAARWFLFAGPGHYAINRAYSDLVGRPFLPPSTVFRHTRGRDVLPPGKPVMVDGVRMNPTVADDILSYARYKIPAGIYHFDRPWAEGSEGFGRLRFDRARFPDAVGMLRVLRARGWRIQVWFSEWQLDERGARARRNGWLAPRSDRELDLTNPDAVAALKADVVGFLRGPEGRYVDGLFLDRTDEVVPSEAGDVYHDGRNGIQMHNAYPVLMQSVLHSALQEARGARGWIIARAGYTGTPRFAMTWGGDTHSRDGIQIPEAPASGPSTDLGLRSVLISMQRSAFMGIPYWGSDIGGYSEFADREVFARWIEIGALSPVMRVHGKGTHAPWDMPTTPRFDREVLDIYRRFVKLHDRLGDELVRLAAEAQRTGAPIARPLVFNYPHDPKVADRWDEWLLGNDLLVAPVWKSGARSRAVYLPAGTWVDFWDRHRVLHGPVEQTEDAPLGRLPLFVRRGSPLLEIPAP